VRKDKLQTTNLEEDGGEEPTGITVTTERSEPENTKEFSVLFLENFPMGFDSK
jgi:hypothetical protein